jgi:signal recognition particle GTPase
MELLEEKIAKLETRTKSMEKIVYDIKQKLLTKNIYKEVVEEVKEKIKKRSYSIT